LRGAPVSCKPSPFGMSPGATGAVRAVRAVKPATAAGAASSATAEDCASVATSSETAGAVVLAAVAAAGVSDDRCLSAAVIDRSAPINADTPSGAPVWPMAAAAATAEKPAPSALRSSLLARDF
jgi:hypothetical protein